MSHALHRPEVQRIDPGMYSMLLEKLTAVLGNLSDLNAALTPDDLIPHIRLTGRKRAPDAPGGGGGGGGSSKDQRLYQVKIVNAGQMRRLGMLQSDAAQVLWICKGCPR